MRPVIVAVAITGSVPRKKDNYAVPIAVSEQIEFDPRSIRGWCLLSAYSCSQSGRDTFFRSEAVPRGHGGNEAILPRHHCAVLNRWPRPRSKRAGQRTSSAT